MGVVLAAIVVLAVISLGIGQARFGGGGQATAEPSGSEGASPGPAASQSPTVPTPVPTMAQRPGTPITATSEEDGIRVTLGLDRDRIAYGERVWADVTVVNSGTDDVYWSHALNCDFAASVSVITPIPLELQYGRTDWHGEIGVLKNVTVGNDATSPGDPAAYFTPEAWIDSVGGRGCVTMSVTDVLPPGGQLIYRAAWDADGPYSVPIRHYGVPIPPGDYLVDATFAYMTRGAPPDVEPIDNKTVKVDLPLTVDSPEVDYLGPGEAFDRVLQSRDFLDQLQLAPRTRWRASTMHFEDGTWVMRLYLERPAIVATVNAISGQVISVVIDPDPSEPIF